MSKKKNKRRNYRNAASTAPTAARAPRVARKPTEDTESTTHRLGYTAAGAAGSALLGSLLKAEDWAPKTIATVVGAVGAGLAWKGEDSMIRSIGAGMMSAAGGQLALQMLAEHDEKKDAKKKDKDKNDSDESAPENAKKTDAQAKSDKSTSRNSGGLPDGALQSAFERARLRYAMGHGEMPAVDVIA